MTTPPKKIMKKIYPKRKNKEKPEKRKYSRSKKDNNTQNKWPPLILAIVAVLSFLVTLVSLYVTYRNVELTNRPFVSIENVYWRQEKDTDWFMSGFKMKNYGNKPAQDFSIRNVKVIILNLDKDSLLEKLKQEKGTIPEQYLQEYFLDFRNKVYWETANILADYLYVHQDVNKADVTNFINSWNNVLPANNILRYKKGLLVRIVEINNDMYDYFSRSSLLIYPNQENAGRRYIQQIGYGGIVGVEKGDNFLILYWSIKYKGLMNKFLNPSSSPIYSTQYVGYHIEPCPRIIDSTGQTSYLLNEIRSWSRTE